MVRCGKALKFLRNLDLVMAGIALVILVAVTFMGVIMRYFLNKPFPWIEEVQMWAIVWVVFFGGGAAFRYGGHVAIDFIVDLFPPFLRTAVAVLGKLVALMIFVFLIVQGIQLLEQMSDFNRLTNILYIPYAFIYSVFPLGCLLMIIDHPLRGLWRRVHQKKGNSSKEGIESCSR